MFVLDLEKRESDVIECVSLAATEMLNQGAPPVPKVNTEHCRACTYLVAPLSYALLCILVWRWVQFQVRKWGGETSTSKVSMETGHCVRGRWHREAEAIVGGGESHFPDCLCRSAGK